MKNECTSHNSIVVAICEPKIVKFGGDMPKFWQKQVGNFFGPPCISNLYIIVRPSDGEPDLESVCVRRCLVCSPQLDYCIRGLAVATSHVAYRLVNQSTYH